MMTSQYASSSSKMLAIGELILAFLNEKKIEIFKFIIGSQLACKINSIKFYKEWWNRNTVKISFCKVAVPLVKLSIKDVKKTKNKKKQTNKKKKKQKKKKKRYHIRHHITQEKRINIEE